MTWLFTSSKKHTVNYLVGYYIAFIMGVSLTLIIPINSICALMVPEELLIRFLGPRLAFLEDFPGEEELPPNLHKAASEDC